MVLRRGDLRFRVSGFRERQKFRKSCRKLFKHRICWAGNRKPETGNRKPETGNRKPETEGLSFKPVGEDQIGVAFETKQRAAGVDVQVALFVYSGSTLLRFE